MQSFRSWNSASEIRDPCKQSTFCRLHLKRPEISILLHLCQLNDFKIHCFTPLPSHKKFPLFFPSKSYFWSYGWVPLLSWLRGSVGFWKVQKGGKSRQWWIHLDKDKMRAKVDKSELTPNHGPEPILHWLGFFQDKNTSAKILDLNRIDLLFLSIARPISWQTLGSLCDRRRCQKRDTKPGKSQNQSLNCFCTLFWQASAWITVLKKGEIDLQSLDAVNCRLFLRQQ